MKTVENTWHESERTNETTRERSGEVMTRDRKGTRGGINYRIPVRISACFLKWIIWYLCKGMMMNYGEQKYKVLIILTIQ